jgi:hypothetical protein
VVVSTFGEGRLSDAPLIGLSLTISLSFPLRGPWSSRQLQHLKKLLQNWGESADRNAT